MQEKTITGKIEGEVIFDGKIIVTGHCEVSGKIITNAVQIEIEGDLDCGPLHAAAEAKLQAAEEMAKLLVEIEDNLSQAHQYAQAALSLWEKAGKGEG